MATEKSLRGISNKEMEIISYLEMEEKRFFTKKDIEGFFSSKNEMNVYIHRLKKKGRIERINLKKYYLIPIEAYLGWAEHPFIVADEIFNGGEYYIGGKAAANYWGLIEQLPTVIDVFSKKRQGGKKVLGSMFKFKRVRKMIAPVKRKIKNHSFLIAPKKECEKWIQ